MWTSHGVGRYAPGEADLQCRSVGVRPDNAVLFLHGYEPNGATNWQGSPANVNILRTLCERGSLVLSVDAGGQSTWANDLAIDSISMAVAHAESMAGVTGVTLVGQSMGGLNALIWASRHPEKVHSVVTFISVVDLWDFHQIDAGYGAAIDLAYGGGYSEALMGPERNPMTMARLGTFPAALPIQMWFGLSDPLCRAEIANSFAARLGAVDARPVEGGHELATIGRIDPIRVAEFVRSNVD